ncbi:hypothetical protein BJ875DRAFT_495741 [Amylocarpus encephaloides]|uniref:Uncharacterized protein n=1 Tax=Amylocarpus encephaloides TaxID=45428 RepID=A0A9P8C5T2_9HELO|nr:hypothetical protein BJ875DRAFT_495741 [Amylocarpus encephaloides]
MLSSFTRQAEPQQNYVLPQRKPLRNDLEAARQGVSELLPLRAGGRLKKAVRNLEHDFNHLEKKQRPELREDLFWYQDFGARSSNAFRFSNTDTFATLLIKLRSTLKHSSRSTTSNLQICIINTSPLPKQVLSFPARCVASTIGRLEGVLTFPRYAIGIELEQAWGGLSDCAFSGIEHPEEMLKVDHLSLPEFRRQFLSHTFTNCKCKTYQVPRISNVAQSESLDRRSSRYESDRSVSRSRFSTTGGFSIELPSKGRQDTSTASKAQLAQCCRIFDRTTASFSFTWQRSAPRYQDTVSSFTWEKHANPPSCYYAEIFYQDDRGIPGPRKVMMSVGNDQSIMESGLYERESSQLMDDLKHFLKTRKPDDPDVWPFMLLLQSNPQGDGYNMLPLFVLFEVIVRDTAVFLKEASDEIMRLSYISRSSPSANLIVHLSHLDTCRDSALHSLSQVHSMIRDLSSIIKQRHRPRENNAPPSIEAEFLKEKRIDVEFLIEQLEDHLRERIRGESVLMKEGRMLMQCRQISTLTWILTLWVPLSLLIGIMSMNVTSPGLIFQALPAAIKSTTPNATSAASQVATATRNIARQVTLTSFSTLAIATPSSPSVPISNPTDSILTSISNNTSRLVHDLFPQPYNFPFPLFLILLFLVPAITLFTALTLPSFLRSILRSTSSLRRSPSFLPVTFAAYYAGIYWILPAFTANSANPNTRISSIVAAGANPISTPSFILSSIAMTTILLVNLSTTLRLSRGFFRAAAWLLFAVVLVVSYAIDFFSSWQRGVNPAIATGLSLTGMVPTLYLVGVWACPRIWVLVVGRRKRPKRRVREDREVREETGNGRVRFEDEGVRRGILKR